MPTPNETYTTVAEDLRRGEQVKRMTGGDCPYKRLHWWEQTFSRFEQAKLDEARALRAALDVIIERLGGGAA